MWYSSKWLNLHATVTNVWSSAYPILTERRSAPRLWTNAPWRTCTCVSPSTCWPSSRSCAPTSTWSTSPAAETSVRSSPLYSSNFPCCFWFWGFVSISAQKVPGTRDQFLVAWYWWWLLLCSYVTPCIEVCFKLLIVYFDANSLCLVLWFCLSFSQMWPSLLNPILLKFKLI